MQTKKNATPKYIVTVGASAGGLHSIIELLASISDKADVAILIVLHTPNITYGEVVLQRLQKNTSLHCKLAEHKEPIQNKHVYLAVPDKHLLVKEGHILLGDGPVENRWRPSIDVLFRSAAVAYNSQVIGVVLTGLLEDGTSGMQFIKSCGGTCMVQDPEEAEFPDMPLSVLRNVEVDYCTSLQQIGTLIVEKALNGNPEPHTVPPEMAAEAKIAERVSIGIEKVNELGGEKSVYSCPDCGGGLWELRQGQFLRFRCHTGHMYTATDLLNRQNENLESTMWVAMRMMEERKNLLDKLAIEEESKGWLRSATMKQERAAELQEHIVRLKSLLFATRQAHDNPPPDRTDALNE